MSDTYFNDHYTSQSYVNRPRVVTLERSDTYLAVSLAVKQGKKDEEGRPATTQQLDCNVVGTQAKAMVEALIEYLESFPEGESVIVSATSKAGDIQPGHSYTAKRGKNQGKTITPLRGRLIALTHVYVNGERFREDLDGNDESHAQQDEPVTESVQQAVEPANGESQAQQPDAESLAKEVKLSKDDPDFMAKKEQLKSLGYRWNPNSTSWVLSENVQTQQSAAA
ncbi:MAG TPA: DUF3577 domain-containing protein [Thiotrichales bacterium]|nr:DUF3577 domain-containing protein [Thiotrichales bacterium]